MDDSSFDMSFGSAVEGSPAAAATAKGVTSSAGLARTAMFSHNNNSSAININFSSHYASAGVDSSRARTELSEAVMQCSMRGLKNAAVWASELLVGVSKASDDDDGDDNEATINAEFPFHTMMTPKYLLAKSYYDAGELLRCVHVLSPCDESSFEKLNAVELFLWGYSLYLAGEKRKEEKMSEIKNPVEQHGVVNSNLHELDVELSEARLRGSGSIDGFLLYLHGIVQKEMGRTDEARNTFCESARAFPLNWSLWLDLASLCASKDIIAKLHLPEHWAVSFFYGHALVELQHNDEALMMYERVSPAFKTSTYIVAQMALAKYNQRNFERKTHV